MAATTRRTSIFKEHLENDFTEPAIAESKRVRHTPSVRFSGKDDVHVVERYDDAISKIGGGSHHDAQPRFEQKQAKTTPTLTPAQTQSPLPVRDSSNMYRLGVFTFLLVAVVPLLQSTSFFGHASVLQPVSGSAIPRRDIVQTLDRRADSPTNVCFRWAQQNALVNGTLYLYGGQATTEPGQDTDAWNNNFLSLDLTKTWQIATPALTGRPQPSGPPNVSLGYLWSSHDSLFLYGGQFSWKPPVPPTAYSTWEYAIADDEWIEHSDPVTSKGASSPSDGEPVQRAAEGAGANVPSLGRGFYFGGHLDGYTTEGWSQSVPRKYLQSLLEFTFPGAKNSQVEALSSDREAGDSGVYRNVTEGGQQAQVGFTQRADGLLIYVPGFGDEGILLAVAGGTNETFTQMNNIDVYDIATSSWYIQSTSGTSPTIRVNPCAVIAAAPDGTSYNIYMYGGQNLIPAGNQTQFDDMWILTLPSFTWIKVDTDGQSVPPGRSGHTCNVWDSQMVMVGGYTGAGTLTCETPGIYVFDLSALEWVNQFTATSSGSDDGTRTTTNKQSNGDDSTGENNPFNQQPAQRYSADSAGGLEGSYGYKVPQAVIDVVGGNENGGATLTTPVNTATAGPLATGKPITYTNADGSTSTSTPGSSNGSGGGGGGANIGAIVAGVIAGVLFIIACYLAFCAYVYRKQLQLYKRHVEMSQAQARGEKMPAIPGLLATDASSNGKTTPSDPSRFGGSVAKWPTNSDGRPSGSHHSRHESGGSSHATPGTGGYNAIRRNSDVSDGDEDLLGGHEPTFVGVMLNPRRSLRVINRD